MPSLFDRRFLIVSGKGGVGRTTVAAALARAAAARGKRVLLAQMESHDRLAGLLGRTETVGPKVTRIAEGFDAVNMTPRESLHEYALMVLHYETIYRALFDNKAVQSFLGAIPGLDAYAMLGKAWWHTTETVNGRPKYDLVVLDGPASGHSATMLRIPQAILEAVPKGPLSRDAEAMRSLFSDANRSAFVIVTLAEDLPARETAQLARTAREELRLPLSPVIVNGIPPADAIHPDVTTVLQTIGGGSGDPRLDATVAGADILAERRRDADRALIALAKDPALPLVELPRLPTTSLGPAEIETLARLLGSSPLLA